MFKYMKEICFILDIAAIIISFGMTMMGFAVLYKIGFSWFALLAMVAGIVLFVLEFIKAGYIEWYNNK